MRETNSHFPQLVLRLQQAVFINIFLLSVVCLAEPIGCVNGMPIERIEYDRLFRSELLGFQDSVVFDPWKSAPAENLRRRQQLLELAQEEKIPVSSDEVSKYKQEFVKKQQLLGEPSNTYDLDLYAKQNAQLKQHFWQQSFARISNSLLEKDILKQHAVKIGLIVTPEEVEQRLVSVKAKYPSREAFAGFLQSYESNERELKAALYEQILIEKLKAAFYVRQGFNQANSPQQASVNAYDSWVQSIKGASQTAFSLNPNDPELQLCLRNSAKPQPRYNDQAEVIQATKQAEQDSQKDNKFFSSKKIKSLYQSGKEKMRFKKSKGDK